MKSIINKIKQMMENKTEIIDNELENATQEAANELETNPEIYEITETEKLEASLQQANERYARLFSEFENYKRRSSRERIELIKTASKDVVVDMVSVLDDFERGIAATEKTEDIAALRSGIDLIYQKFKNLLFAKGLQPIEALHQPFDVSLHEAITHVPAADEAQKNTVFAEVEKGYKLGETVIRYTKVVVAV